MLKTFVQLLGEDASIFRRYTLIAAAYGVLCGLSIATLVPTVTHLLAGNVQGATPWLITLLVGVTICWGLRQYVEQAGIRIGVAILQGARHRLGDHISSMPAGWFCEQNTAHLSHIVTQGMMAVAQLPAHVFTPVITGVLTPLVLVLAMLILHWQLGLIALAALPLLAAVLTLTAKLSRRADATFRQHFAEASQRMVEFAQSQSVLRAFNGEGNSLRLLEEASLHQRQSGMRLIWRSAGAAVLNSWAVQAVFAILLMSSALWLNDYLDSGLPNGDLTALILGLLLVSRYVDSLQEVTGYSEVLRNARSQLDAIRNLFTIKPLPEPDVPQAPHSSAIELRNVHFRYTALDPYVLRGVNLHIEPGSMTALIGESGSGKTTLVRLIGRAFELSEGSLLIGDTDIRQISNAQLAGQISQIFQENYLFTGTIAENIRFGMPNASDADVMEAAELAGVAEIIARLPQGLETQVGEGGARLSGGERQRIAIARALIKNTPILLVDEATAALDTENQSVIAETLKRLHGQRTLVVIAHQLSTIAQADQIAVLEDGVIVEQGNPQRLLERQGRYAQFLSQRKTAKGWHITPPGKMGALR